MTTDRWQDFIEMAWPLLVAVVLGLVVRQVLMALARRSERHTATHTRARVVQVIAVPAAVALPLLFLAIAFNGGEPVDWARWFAFDLVWRVLGGAAIGGAVGYGLMYLIFRSERNATLSRSSDGLTALAITLFVYGVAELCQTYGFLAVFVAAVVVRQQERDHQYHATLNLFAEQCERLLMAVLLVLLGGAVMGGILSALTPSEIAFALIFVLVVRPIAGWVGTIGSGLGSRERMAVSLFGVRGIGSLYYLAFATNHADFARIEAVWSMVVLVVLLSILLHGISGKRAMEWLDLQRGVHSGSN